MKMYLGCIANGLYFSYKSAKDIIIVYYTWGTVYQNTKVI